MWKGSPGLMTPITTERAALEHGIGDLHPEPPGQVVARPPLPQPLGSRGGEEQGHASAGRDDRERLNRP